MLRDGSLPGYGGTASWIMPDCPAELVPDFLDQDGYLVWVDLCEPPMSSWPGWNKNSR